MLSVKRRPRTRRWPIVDFGALTERNESADSAWEDHHVGHMSNEGFCRGVLRANSEVPRDFEHPSWSKRFWDATSISSGTEQ